MQGRPPGAPENSLESGGSGQTISTPGDFEKSRTDKYLYDPDDWANQAWYQAKIHIIMSVAFGTIVLAVAELIHLSPSQTAVDFLADPLSYWELNTYFGFTGWFAVIATNTALALILAITSWCRGCANCQASHHNKHHPRDQVSLPYPPLSLTGGWCFWNLAFWAGAIGWMSRFWWIGPNINIIQQMAWYSNIWWFVIICAMFTCLRGILHRMRHMGDSWLFWQRSSCFDC